MPVVEADPSDESLRRSLLGMIEHPILREIATKAPLKSIEQLIVASDHVAYEEWFAKQPKVPFGQVDLPESLKADIEEVTKHNPPWMRGQYLSYYRPPVPAHLFDPDYANDEQPAAEPAAIAPPPGETIPSLRARLARLLDRAAARLPEELDLAEAVCAIKWPKWPDYRGPIDLGLLRRALDGTVIDGPTLNWLGGKEIVRECGVGGPMASGSIGRDGLAEAEVRASYFLSAGGNARYESFRHRQRGRRHRSGRGCRGRRTGGDARRSWARRAGGVCDRHRDSEPCRAGAGGRDAQGGSMPWWSVAATGRSARWPGSWPGAACRWGCCRWGR